MTFQDLLDFEGMVFLNTIGHDGDLRLRARLCLGGHQLLPRGPIIGRRGDDLANEPLEYTEAPYVDLGWERYLHFTVTDESFAAFRKDETYVGHAIRFYSRSWLLDHVGELTNGAQLQFGEVRHITLACGDHFVNVLAYSEPTVTDLGPRPVAFGKPQRK